MKQMEIMREVYNSGDLNKYKKVTEQWYFELRRKDGTFLIDHALRSGLNYLYYSLLDENISKEKLADGYKVLLLHDIIEDTGIDVQTLESYNIPKSIIEKVLKLTKNKEDNKTFVEIFSNMIYSMNKMDEETLILKLCDRLDNSYVRRDLIEDNKQKDKLEKFTFMYLLQTKEIIKRIKSDNIIVKDLINQIRLRIEKEIEYYIIKEYNKDHNTVIEAFLAEQKNNPLREALDRYNLYKRLCRLHDTFKEFFENALKGKPQDLSKFKVVVYQAKEIVNKYDGNDIEFDYKEIFRNELKRFGIEEESITKEWLSEEEMKLVIEDLSEEVINTANIDYHYSK